MVDYIKQIQTLEQTIQANRTELAKLSERLEVNKEERKKLLTELQTLGIDEKDLSQKISALEEELTNKIHDAEESLK